MTGGAVGRVVESTSADVPVGAAVTHDLGWRDVAQGDAAQFRVVDDGVPLSAYLGVLGLTGFTAHLGLLQIASMQPGEVVFVSGAAGAVGSVVGQIAQAQGRVAGRSAPPGRPRRWRWCRSGTGSTRPSTTRTGTSTGSCARPRRTGSTCTSTTSAARTSRRRSACCGGTVGSPLCGAISGYNDEHPQPGPRNLARIIQQGLTLRGFTVPYHLQHYPAFLADMRGWFAAGQIAYDETVVDGLDHAVDAFLAMMRGETTGKTVVRVPDRRPRDQAVNCASAAATTGAAVRA